MLTVLAVRARGAGCGRRGAARSSPAQRADASPPLRASLVVVHLPVPPKTQHQTWWGGPLPGLSLRQPAPGHPGPTNPALQSLAPPCPPPGPGASGGMTGPQPPCPPLLLRLLSTSIPRPRDPVWPMEGLTTIPGPRLLGWGVAYVPGRWGPSSQGHSGTVRGQGHRSPR